MKKKALSLIAMLISFIFFLNTQVIAQSTNLAYKAKGKSTYGVVITFSDDAGNTTLEPSQFFSYNEIYFVLSPAADSPKDFFKESDAEEFLAKIVIDQNGTKVNQSAQARYLLNTQGKLDRIVIAFPKNTFQEYNEFSFNVESFFSDKITLEERFFQSYEPQKNSYEGALSKLEEGEFIEAYNDFIKIVNSAGENAEIKSFSFFSPILSKDVPALIDAFIENRNNTFNTANESFQQSKSIDLLNACDKIVKEATEKASNFDSFFELKDIDSSGSKDKVLAFVNNLNDLNNKNFRTFEEEKMGFFKKGSYREYQFDLYLDLISKMLLYKNSLSIIEKLDTININLLKRFPKGKNELIGDWKNQFEILVRLINKNIEQSGIVFKEDVMENLQNLTTSQKQPYFEIFSAFNALNEDQDSFKTQLQSALLIASDETILDYIEYWLLSFRLTDEGINSAYMSQLNEGISLIERKQFDRADDSFSLLMKIANQYAPVWFYSGQIKHSMGESFSAERFFNKAIEIYPNYLAPRRYILKIFEESENYNQMLENTNKAIQTMDAWYFRYKKASALYRLKKYDEAINEINTECLKKNAWDINQYFLLSDAYRAIGDFEKAKAACEKTLDIDPFSTDSKEFDDRMKVIYEEMEKAKKVPVKTAPQSAPVKRDTTQTSQQ